MATNLAIFAKMLATFLSEHLVTLIIRNKLRVQIRSGADLCEGRVVNCHCIHLSERFDVFRMNYFKTKCQNFGVRDAPWTWKWFSGMARSSSANTVASLDCRPRVKWEIAQFLMKQSQNPDKASILVLICIFTLVIWNTTIWNWKHLKSRLFEGRISNGPFFKWSGFVFGYSLAQPFENWRWVH